MGTTFLRKEKCTKYSFAHFPAERIYIYSYYMCNFFSQLFLFFFHKQNLYCGCLISRLVKKFSQERKAERNQHGQQCFEKKNIAYKMDRRGDDLRMTLLSKMELAGENS